MSETAEKRLESAAARPISRRHVFYVPGYDPIAPRRYRELYRKEGARQARISGYELLVAPGRAESGNYAWTVEATMDGHRTESLIEFLTWDDIVKDSMDRTILSTYAVLLHTFWIYASSGALWRLFRLRPAPMIAAIYPLVALTLQLGLALGLGVVVAQALGPTFSTWVGIAGGIATAGVVLTLFHRFDRYFFAYYLANDYAFTARHGGRWPEPLEERITEFGRRIAAVSTRADIDEVLLVGHSSGAHIGLSALAAARRRMGPNPRGKLGFLTLGQVIPMQSFLPHATSLRADIHALARDPHVTWVDISAPGDGGCFALSDPVRVTGVAPPEGETYGPKVISAAFALSMSEEELRRTRFRFFRRHSQYLYAFERPRGYDYFSITGGPLSLEARFGTRGSTASRIERPLSGYRDVK